MSLFHKHDCATEGHRWRTEKRSGLKKGPRLGNDEEGIFHFRCMAHEVEQKRKVCRDCKEAEPWRTIWGQCIQSISLPASEFRQLEKEGFV